MKTHRQLMSVAIACALVAIPFSMRAQEPPRPLPGRIMGLLVDAATSSPIVDAELRLIDSDVPPSFSDGSGRFSFASVSKGVHEIEIRHIAYGSGKELVNVPEGETVHLELRLQSSAIALDTLIITADARPSRLAQVGVLRRQRAGWGHILTGEDAASWKIEQSLMMIPRVEVSGPPIRTVIVRHPLFGACIPEIYLDGVYQRGAEGDLGAVIAGLEFDAVEVYTGMTTPPEFKSSGAKIPCGAIVLWRQRH